MLKPKEKRRESGRKSLRNRFPARLKNQRLKVLSISAVIPNIATLLALCSGMTAIRMAMLEKWELSVVALLVAAFLDGMDGRLARLLGSTSRFGAELDSFSDLISFGAAPSIVMYMKGLHKWGETGWCIILFFTVCMTLRLARFNTRSIEGNSPTWSQGFFTGVPAPAAGYLALMPIMIQQFCNAPIFESPLLYAIVMIMTGGLMISRIPTFSLKKVKVPQRLVIPIMLLAVLTACAVYSHPWLTLSMIGLIYMGLIPFSIRSFRRVKKETEALEQEEKS
ncbi:MAG: CDP-diacylglycerol--serine O-phosphatidyltransferase [Alphaproteobacteria bacterium]|nr:CDP-diacylglycerol--serine O-phosphatidyltransferase [Alphaproteobacteria bacterium]